MVAQHLLISLLPWALGMAMGAGLGYFCALLTLRLLRSNPLRRKWLAFIPWRTFAVTSTLLFPLIPLWTGLGTFAGAVIVGTFVVVFATPLSTIIFIEHNKPNSLSNRLASLARTLATVSIIIAGLAGFFGGGGFGYAIIQAWQFMEYHQLIRIFIEIASITFLVDILLGIVQLRVSSIHVEFMY